MDKEFREQIKDILQHEVLLATGCTEPGAVALCVSKACELLDGEPERIVLKLSKNVFKNAMGVGIPGTIYRVYGRRSDVGGYCSDCEEAYEFCFPEEKRDGTTGHSGVGVGQTARIASERVDETNGEDGV